MPASVSYHWKRGSSDSHKPRTLPTEQEFSLTEALQAVQLWQHDLSSFERPPTCQAAA